jgi:two-component system response regulator DevR
MAIRVFLLDDHAVVRAGVRRLCEDAGDLVVVGEASSGPEALAQVERLQPDVAVIDVRLGDDDMDGIDVCREIRSRHPSVACLILTSYSDDDALARAVLAGAAGYVLKQIEGNALVESVRTAAGGGRTIDDQAIEKVLGALANRHGAGDPDRLTPRERQILELISLGRTNREIGEQLFLAEKTVKNYVSNLLAKLGMARRSEAAAYAARLAERRGARAADRPAHRDERP